MGKSCAKLTQFFRDHDGLDLLEVVLDGATDDQIIEVTPLGDFVPSHAEAFLDDRGGIEIPFLKAFLECPEAGGRKEYGDESRFQLLVVFGPSLNCRGSLDIDVQEHIF